MIDNGGQAFPGEYSTFEYQGDPAYVNKTRIYHHITGMTLRDYMAIDAMQAVIGLGLETRYEKIAEHAYLQADAMLKEREK